MKAGGVSTTQKAALALRAHVRRVERARQKLAIEIVMEDLGRSKRSVEKGLEYAKEMRWIEAHPVPGGKNNEMELVLGPLAEEE